MSYHTVPTTEVIGETKDLDLIFPNASLIKFVGGNGGVCERNTPRKRCDGCKKDERIVFRIDTEAFRFITYILFWVMCFTAILITKFYMHAFLLAGPGNVTNSCSPFKMDDFLGSDPVDRTNGFDIYTESPLKQVLGYNNICTFWDFSPSLEIIAVIYAYVEYALITYIVAEFTLAAISYKKGYVSKRYWKVHKIMFPINLVLCASFRMVFVVAVDDSLRGHTAGFVSLQLALISVALLNMFRIFETNVCYPFLGSIKNTKRAAIVFVIIEVVLSVLSTYLHAYIVFGWGLGDDGHSGHMFPPWAKEMFLGTTWSVGSVIDNSWMGITAVCPLFIAYVQMKTEPALIITIDLEPPNFLS